MAAEVADIVHNSLTAANNVLKLYDTGLDQFIPWSTFKETCDTLRKYQHDYSTQAGQIVGDTITLILNSQDAYQDATRSVYEWCELVIPLLQGYLELLPNYSRESAEGQKAILMEVLENGIKKMNDAQGYLGKSRESFNKAAGSLAALNTQLHDDFDTTSSYFQNQIDIIRKKAYGGAVVGIFGGPFGLIVSYSIAAGVVEGKLIPDLKAKCNEVADAYKTLQQTIDKANQDLTDVKQKLQYEIGVISDMKVQTQQTCFWVSLGGLMIKRLTDSLNKLIDMCQKYIERHSTDLQ